MKLLLDTHSFLWFVTNDPLLSSRARTLISDPENDVFVSPASYPEIAIKVSIGKYPMTVPFEKFFSEGLEGNEFGVLPIEIRHAATLASLPMHHKDPFDRIIISQAIAEQLPVISADSAFDPYSVSRLW
ncbi:MAG: type II toxin-antitoxin system VapC family toxin [Planctomycetes bacterium]|nr:type II toxin-antitoxin system VapC family toxin [Planctomycetota bacterium]